MNKKDEKINASAISKRIEQLRKQHSGIRGRSKFARALGVSPSTYSYYENDRIPPIDILLKISEITGTDLYWLITGSTMQENSSCGANSVFLQKLQLILNEHPDMTEAISAFVDLLSEKKGIEKALNSAPEQSGSDKAGWIPVLGRTAAGMVHFWDKQTLPGPEKAVTELGDLVKKHIGKEIVNSTQADVSVDLQARSLLDGLKGSNANLIQVAGQQADKIAEFIDCQQIRDLYTDCFALRIDGDSMSPRINDGGVVILSPSVPAGQGQIAIACVANQIGVTCKLIRTTEKNVHLIPINEKYETKIVPKKDLLWSLAVLCHMHV